MEKNLIIGFKSIYLAKVTAHDAAQYATDAGQSLPFAGKMSMTANEAKQALYYDDGVYVNINDLKGYDVELRVAQISYEMMEALGIGTYNQTTNSFQENMTVQGGEYSLRFVADTADHYPYYFKFRVFKITSIRPDNFATAGDSITPNEIIITGTISNPQTTGLTYKASMQLLTDQSNLAACNAFLTDAETFPLTPTP